MRNASSPKARALKPILSAAAVLSLLAPGLSGAREMPPVPRALPGAAGTAEPALVFGECPASLPGEPVGRDCATSQVPSDWSASKGSKIELTVVRYRNPKGDGSQLWLLDGGPGGTGVSFMTADTIARYQDFGFDLYIPQHRGTGDSTPLECDPTLGIAACGSAVLTQFPNDLQAFNSHQAGEDLGHLIKRAGGGSARVFVRAISYGTYWAQRYLQSFPNQAKGVVLDGLLPLGAPVWDIDPLADQAGRAVFVACQADQKCARAFSWRDPYVVAQGVLERADDPARRCLASDGPDRMSIERWLNFLDGGNMSQAVPGLVLRLDRCDAYDQQDLKAFADFVTSMTSGLPDPQYFDVALAWHVMRTDLMSSIDVFPLEEKIQARAPLVFWSGAAYAEDLDAMTTQWPVNYPPLANDLSTPKSRLLVMTGGLDMATPSPWAADFASRNKATIARFPYAGHVVDDSLSMPFATGDIDCSLRIQRAFYNHPDRAIDTSCTLAKQTLDVAGRTSNSDLLAQALYASDTQLLGHPTDGEKPAHASPARRAADRDRLKAQHLRGCIPGRAGAVVGCRP